MSLMRLALVVFSLLLSGCDALLFEYRYQTYMSNCIGMLSNSCNNKAVKFNILLLKQAKKEMLTEGIEKLGIKNSDEIFFKESIEEDVASAIASFKKIRPGLFSRLFLGDAQPLDGKSVLILRAEDKVAFQKALIKSYLEKLAKH